MKEQKLRHIEALTKIKDNSLIAIASTETEDRVGDSLKAMDWDLRHYKNNPVLQAGHDHKPQYTIGIAKNIQVDEKNRLTFEPYFHEFTQLARDIKAMYKGGILKAWSVGFMPKDEDEEENSEKGSERSDRSYNQLLEVSAVAVPANAEALTMVKKGIENADKLEDTQIKEIEDWTKKGCGEEEKEECKPCEEKIETEEKSPSCRKDGETKSDCVARKIPELMKETPSMKQEQAIAIANGLCTKLCGTKAVKKRWNKQLSKAFDIEKVDSKPATFEYEIYTKFLGCKIKDVFVNSYLIPSPLLGTYLAGFKKMLDRFELIDTRNFAWGGGELPPVYEVIKLNSEKSDDFLIDGMNFYKSDGKNAVIVKFTPTWVGMNVTMINRASKREVNKGLLNDVHKWVKDNNFLKNEKFALSGEFLPKSKKTWDDVILSSATKEPIANAIKMLNKKKNEARSRGLLFMGEPGTGKTQSGKVIMKEAEATFIWVSSKDFERNAYQSSSLLGLAFKLARDLSPSVLFIEDIDSWLKGSAIDTLKIEMDGIRENKGIVTILTTNFPENLPKALLDRPGRFHDVLDFELPDSDVRKKMITKWTDKIETKTLDDMVEKTKGYSGAYIKELIDYAEMIAEDEDISMDKALIISFEKLQKQRALVEEIEKRKQKEEEQEENDKKMRDMIEKAIEASNKEGKMLSGKSKRIITDAVMASKDATSALEKLLEATEDTKLNNKSVIALKKKPLKLKGDGEAKGRIIKRKADKLPIDFIVERVVRRVLESN